MGESRYSGKRSAHIHGGKKFEGIHGTDKHRPDSVNQARLANPGLADDEDDRAVSGPGLFGCGGQRLELLLAFEDRPAAHLRIVASTSR